MKQHQNSEQALQLGTRVSTELYRVDSDIYIENQLCAENGQKTAAVLCWSKTQNSKFSTLIGVVNVCEKKFSHGLYSFTKPTLRGMTKQYAHTTNAQHRISCDSLPIWLI